MNQVVNQAKKKTKIVLYQMKNQVENQARCQARYQGMDQAWIREPSDENFLGIKKSTQVAHDVAKVLNQINQWRTQSTLNKSDRANQFGLSPIATKHDTTIIKG